MSALKYSVNQQPIQILLGWIQSGDIAIPEIQRPFVWSSTQVRNLLDSLLKGYPVGYLITWRNPSVRLKDGSQSAGKRILIDGQQRITALMASLLGQQVLTKRYKLTRIRIAYHPQQRRFEVYNSAIAKDASWIPDISKLFEPNFKHMKFINDYCRNNPSVDEENLNESIEQLRKIVNNPIGIIELDSHLDIDTVTEIFIRVNSAGVPLNQADFAMSKISVNNSYGGQELRKAIDYFCHLAIRPSFYQSIEQNDVQFAKSDYYAKMMWLRHENSDLYDPSYADVIRVAFTSEFKRGRLSDLVALLSGRNFDTRQYEEAVVEDTFVRMKKGVMRFINETNFKSFLMIIRSAGFLSNVMITSGSALNMAYSLYLVMNEQNYPKADIERTVRRWFVMSLLTQRYTGSPESAIDFDIRQTLAGDFIAYSKSVISTELSDTFWQARLPQGLVTPTISSPFFRVFQAAQVKLGDKGFLSRDITVRELTEIKSDIHHIFPRDMLKKRGMDKTMYNQVANYAITQTEINLAISNKPPSVYFVQILQQSRGGRKYYGNIVDEQTLQENLVMNCIPQDLASLLNDDYEGFLAQRRVLMAQRIRQYFERL